MATASGIARPRRAAPNRPVWSHQAPMSRIAIPGRIASRFSLEVRRTRVVVRLGRGTGQVAPRSRDAGVISSRVVIGN